MDMRSTRKRHENARAWGSVDGRRLTYRHPDCPITIYVNQEQTIYEDLVCELAGKGRCGAHVPAHPQPSSTDAVARARTHAQTGAPW